MEPRTVDVVVVGAGISGLCVAHWLTKRGVEVLVLEKDAEVGGTMKSFVEQGFLVERGPNSALETTPLIQELVEELNLRREFMYANPAGKNRFILKNGSLIALPLNPIAFLSSKLFSAAAKLRVLKEPFIGRGTQEESVAEFVVRRLGQEFLDYAIDPFVAGVYAAKPEQLSVRAAFPKLYALEERYGGLIKGMVKGRKERRQRAEKAKDHAQTFSFLHGMQQLPVALASELGERVLCNAEVTGLNKSAHSFQAPDESHARRYTVEFLRNGSSEKVEADVVVLSAPAFASSVLVRSLSPAAAQTLSSIHYAPVVSLFLGFKREDVTHPLNGFGFLVPSLENRNILGCLWSSSLFSYRAPEKLVSFTVFIGGSRQPELVNRDNEQLLEIALEELKSIMQITGNPVYWRVTRWQKAIPQYELGYERLLAALRQFEVEHKGIVFCSNYLRGIAVGDCIKSAYETAAAVETTKHVTTAHPL
ncbi:MAG: protoporphyrinogen oxidase [Bacteroidota bacterium]